MTALAPVKKRVKKCGGSGVAMAAIKVSGKTGRVSSVTVSGAGAARACVAKAVKSARFPKFQQANFSVRFPFRL